MLTLFYDGLCPLCRREIAVLSRYNQPKVLHLVDIHSDEFATHYPHINKEAADRLLHAEQNDGSLLIGLDANLAVWRAVNKHRWLQLLKLPIIHFFANVAYRLFAKYRHTLSYLLTGEKPCAVCTKDQCKTK